MSAVSCTLCSWLLEMMARAGLSPERWTRSLPVTLEQLRSPDQRIDWDVFVTLCERLEQLFGGAEPLLEAARGFAAEKLAEQGPKLSGGFTNERQIYWIAQRWLAPWLFPHLSASFSELPKGRIRIALELPPAPRTYPRLFPLIGCALAEAPRLLGRPPASVDGEYGENRAVYTIAPAAAASGELSDPCASRLRALVENAYDLIAEITLDGRFVYVGPIYRKLLGYAPEELLGTSALDLVHPDDREMAMRGLEQAQERDMPAGRPLRARHRDGRWRFIETHLKRYRTDSGEMRAVVTSRDVTERQETEEALRESREQLLQSQKLEAIGRLAGGVAHDFNNLLTAITGYCDLLLDDLGEDHPLRNDAEEIIRAANRAGALTRQLLAFSRRQVLQPRVLDLNALVSDVDRLLRRLIGEDVELVTALEGGLPCVQVDPAQMEQLIMNLAVNARDAMPTGGRLGIETSRVEIPAGGDRAHPGVPPGTHIALTVQDTGVGMDSDTVSRIFEPFFTTKQAGKGTGLGLSTVYGIVQQSHGQIRVESRPEQGSTFTVYLPVAGEDLEAPEERRVCTELRGGETILLVEDAEPVRAMVRKYLEKHGYSVLDASSGIEALRIFDHRGGAVDLLLTDVVLPKMNGRELAERLARVRPELKVLYMSGFSDEALSEHGVFDSDVPLVQKPFAPPELLRKAREILDATAPPTDAARG